MANKTPRISAKTEPKKIPCNACCKNCLHAQLLRYGNNPIIAECHKKPQPGNDKFPYERMVASSQVCNEWKQDASDKVIKQVA